MEAASNQQCTAAQVPACPFSLVNERFFKVIFWNDFEQEMCGLHLMARNHDATICFAMHVKFICMSSLSSLQVILFFFTVKKSDSFNDSKHCFVQF